MTGATLDNYPQFASTAEVRAWARSKKAGASIGTQGYLPRYVIAAWNKSHPDRPHDGRAFAHGTATGYDRGCRCDECTAAKVERSHADLRARVECGLPTGDSRHGTSTGYDTWGCRCKSCREAQHRRYEASKGSSA